MSCLFSLDDAAPLTDEHIFPAVLGGTLVVKATTCGRCATTFSREVEQPLAEALLPLRRLFAIPDRYGRLAEPPAKAKVGEIEFDAKLLCDGRVQLKPVVTQCIGLDGKKEIEFKFVTPALLGRLQQNALRDGLELVEEQIPSMDAEITVSGELDFIDQPIALRNATKIAYTVLAAKTGTAYAQKEEFQKARAYMLEARGESVASLFWNDEYLSTAPQGPHQHSVVLVGRRDQHVVHAVVRLFGALCHYVVLSDSYDGVDFADTLILNAQTGEKSGTLVTHIETEFLQIDFLLKSSRTIWRDRVIAGEGLVEFMNAAIQRALSTMQGK